VEGLGVLDRRSRKRAVSIFELQLNPFMILPSEQLLIGSSREFKAILDGSRFARGCLSSSRIALYMARVTVASVLVAGVIPDPVRFLPTVPSKQRTSYTPRLERQSLGPFGVES